MTDQLILLAERTTVINFFAKAFAIRPAEVGQYVRYLREYGIETGQDLWPLLSHGRGPKYEIGVRHASALFLALAASPTAAAAGECAASYGALINDGRAASENFSMPTANASFLDVLAKLVSNKMEDFDVEIDLRDGYVMLYEQRRGGISIARRTAVFSIRHDDYGDPMSNILPHWAHYRRRSGRQEGVPFDTWIQRRCRIMGPAIFELGAIFRHIDEIGA